MFAFSLEHAQKKIETGREEILPDDKPILVRDLINVCSVGMAEAGLANIYFNEKMVSLETSLGVGTYDYYVETPSQ